MAESEPRGPGAAADQPTTPPAGGAVELRDAPPFLSWRAIYIIVLAALAADIALAATLSAHYG